MPVSPPSRSQGRVKAPRGRRLLARKTFSLRNKDKLSLNCARDRQNKIKREIEWNRMNGNQAYTNLVAVRFSVKSCSSHYQAKIIRNGSLIKTSFKVKHVNVKIYVPETNFFIFFRSSVQSCKSERKGQNDTVCPRSSDPFYIGSHHINGTLIVGHTVTRYSFLLMSQKLKQQIFSFGLYEVFFLS
mgnify:CR=1 FL=1